MNLSQTAEYALRAAVCLAQAKPSQVLPAKTITEQTGVPPAYLSKLLRRMVVNGILVAQKGHGGGFKLARPALEISFYDVLDAVECLLEPDRCVFGLDKCNVDAPCALHDAWSGLNSSIVAWSKQHTLGGVKKLHKLS